MFLLGSAAIPPYELLSFIGAPWLSFNLLVALVYFACAGVVIGKIAITLWHRGWIDKFALVAVLVLNSGYGFLMASLGNVRATENPTISCQRFINPQQGIRIIKFDQYRILPGGYHFYLFTQDGGKTWRQLFWDEEDDNVASHCEALQALNEDFLWIWSWRYLRISRDGGQNWDAWDWECCAHGFIRQVEFQTETFGTMFVYPGQGSITELTTQDGGKTWTPKLSP